MKRYFALALVAALSLTASASPAPAAVGLGQLGSPTSAVHGDWVQRGVAAGSYVVPSTGGITSWSVVSWSHFAEPGAGGMLTLKFFRGLSGQSYMAVGHDGPRVIAPGGTNTFSVTNNLTVRPGDVLGLRNFGSVGATFYTAKPADLVLLYGGNLGDFEIADFENSFIFPSESYRLDISAVLDPTNTFSLGAVKRNKKKGTATLTVDVPNPGQLALSGNGVKSQTDSAGAAGEVKLPVKAKGKTQKKLNETGKVKLTPNITFTPTGGEPATQSQKLQLKKKL